MTLISRDPDEAGGDGTGAPEVDEVERDRRYDQLADIPLPDVPQSEEVSGLALIPVRIHAGVAQIGDIGKFSVEAIKTIPRVRLYPSEVFRQTALLIIGSGLIIWMMLFVMGLECGTEASYILKQFGAPLYSGIFDAFCDLRECLPYMWGYIFSAKVGCGLVAEIGSMRISEEIDVLEVMGIRPMSFVVATRLVGYFLAVPFIFAVGLCVIFGGSYFATIIQLKTVSPGGFLSVYWLFQNPLDIFFSFVKVFSETLVIILVGCYYGYKSQGGSVGVGRNTAKSMIVNLIMVHIIGVIGTLAFWGQNPRAPIAN